MTCSQDGAIGNGSSRRRSPLGLFTSAFTTRFPCCPFKSGAGQVRGWLLARRRPIGTEPVIDGGCVRASPLATPSSEGRHRCDASAPRRLPPPPHFFSRDRTNRPVWRFSLSSRRICGRGSSSHSSPRHLRSCVLPSCFMIASTWGTSFAKNCAVAPNTLVSAPLHRGNLSAPMHLRGGKATIPPEIEAAGERASRVGRRSSVLGAAGRPPQRYRRCRRSSSPSTRVTYVRSRALRRPVCGIAKISVVCRIDIPGQSPSAGIGKFAFFSCPVLSFDCRDPVYFASKVCIQIFL